MKNDYETNRSESVHSLAFDRQTMMNENNEDIIRCRQLTLMDIDRALQTLENNGKTIGVFHQGNLERSDLLSFHSS